MLWNLRHDAIFTRDIQMSVEETDSGCFIHCLLALTVLSTIYFYLAAEYHTEPDPLE